MYKFNIKLQEMASITYDYGPKFRSVKAITKADIVTLCNRLNSMHVNTCTFEPEGIAEGGIVYRFTNNATWYKSIRLRLHDNNANGIWPLIKGDEMIQWQDCDDMILEENRTLSTFLKSFNGAPPFTKHEFNMIKESFESIGLVFKRR